MNFMNFIHEIDLKSKIPVQAHDMLEQVQDVLPVIIGVFYYPLWFVSALLYGLLPFEIPYASFFERHSVKSDSYTHSEKVCGAKAVDEKHGQVPNGDHAGEPVVPLAQFAHAQQAAVEDRLEKSVKVPGRDRVIKSLLKIASLDKAHITEIVRGENEMFAENLKFTDHIVSYWDRKEWISSFHALTLMMSAKIVDIESIRDDADLSVVHFRMCWMSPFSFVNEHLMGGMEFNNVMVIKFDGSNRVCQIDEYWNGRDHLDVMGVLAVMRRITALVTLPFCQIISCFTK